MLMAGPVDVGLRDDTRLENELGTRLMLAATDSVGSLTQAQVDAALGL